MGRSSGLTLVELLIALAIFAVLSAMAHGAIRAALEARERIRNQATHLGALQKSMVIIERDVSQMVPRPIRDENGEPLPALISPNAISNGFPNSASRLMEFTRAGWRNPIGARVHLRRIAYELDDGQLLRLVWNVLDRAEDSLPSSSVLLAGVNAVGIRYLGADNEWRTEWPLQRWDRGGPSSEVDDLPRGVEITLDIAGIGPVSRLLVVAQ